jgi:ADP-ribose pyrophosphatase
MFHLVQKQLVYTGKRIRLEVHHLDDDEGRRTQKEVVVHPGAVVILPFLDDKTVVLIRNRRWTLNQVLWEIPAGAVEKAEVPMNAAGRELQEETGYLAGRLKPFMNLFPSPGILTEKMYCFVAYDLRKLDAAPELGEEIEVVPTAWDDAIDMIRTGQIEDGKTIACILAYDRFHRTGAPFVG